MGWLETRGKLRPQLRAVLESNGWEADVSSYEYLRYRKGGWYPKGGLIRTGGLTISCTITLAYNKLESAPTGYWITLSRPMKSWRPGKRPILRRFKAKLDQDISEEKVLSKIESLYNHEPGRKPPERIQ